MTALRERVIEMAGIWQWRRGGGAGLLGARAGVFQYHPCGERASGNRALLKSIVANHRAGHPTPALCVRFPLPSLIPIAAVCLITQTGYQPCCTYLHIPQNPRPKKEKEQRRLETEFHDCIARESDRDGWHLAVEERRGGRITRGTGRSLPIPPMR